MTSISAYGSTQSLYFKQVSGTISYSLDNSSWTAVSSWPVSITNLDSASSAVLNILFTTDLTLTTSTQYFICMTSFLQFGSKTLNSDGSIPKCIVTNVTNYPGLIQNGTSGANGRANISIVNLGVTASGTTSLGDDQGWIGQSYFGKGVSGCVITGCYSTGDIVGPNGAGGIVGAYSGTSSGTLRIQGCYSTGAILGYGGGIAGKYTGQGGTVYFVQCFSTGAISGMYSGGISGLYTGSTGGSIQCVACYSSGIISGNYAGGILGINAGHTNGTVSISYCYSKGAISGSSAGGICGQNVGISANGVIITNSFSTGTIGSTAGGVIGPTTGTYTIQHCYTSGALAGATGGIVGGLSTEPATCYSEGKHLSSGWNDTNANSVLTAGFWIQPNGINTPYLLPILGYSTYSLTNVTDSSGNVFNTSESESIQAGETTSAAIVPGYTYSLLTVTPGITINSSTGRISTTSSVLEGEYELSIFANSSPSYYVVITYILTIATIPSSVPENIQIPNYSNISSEQRYLIEQGQYMSTNSSYTSVKQYGSYSEYLKYRMANKVSGSM